MYADAFAFRLPGTPATAAQTARAEFIHSTEPECRADRDLAAEDARDLAALAVSARSFLYGAVAKLRQLNNGRLPAADLALMSECVVEQIADVLSPEAARLFLAEFRSLGGEG
jgi:hypothetical protein